jgi:hypothetical protein
VARHRASTLCCPTTSLCSCCRRILAFIDALAPLWPRCDRGFGRWSGTIPPLWRRERAPGPCEEDTAPRSGSPPQDGALLWHTSCSNTSLSPLCVLNARPEVAQ